MTAAALAAIVAAGIVLPHALRLQRADPVTATVLWLSSLALRALTGLLAVVLLLLFVPRTDTFDWLTHWCLHAVLPGVSAALNVEGHGFGDVTLFIPGLALAASLVVACVRTARGAGSARRLVAEQAVGRGPEGSVIVSGPEVVFAVAGLAHPRIVVSAGALAWLDDAELAAGLDHERAHIARRHRFILLTAAMLSALGWMVPGTRRAGHQIAFHLERDADRWALRRSNDRLALASVICKAALTTAPATGPAVAKLGETGLRVRLGELLEEQPAPMRHPAAAGLNALAVAMVVFTLVLTAAVPTAAVAGVAGNPHGGHHGHCGD